MAQFKCDHDGGDGDAAYCGAASLAVYYTGTGQSRSMALHRVLPDCPLDCLESLLKDDKINLRWLDEMRDDKGRTLVATAHAKGNLGALLYLKQRLGTGAWAQALTMSGLSSTTPSSDLEAVSRTSSDDADSNSEDKTSSSWWPSQVTLAAGLIGSTLAVGLVYMGWKSYRHAQ
jgi:hypothetical protein